MLTVPEPFFLGGDLFVGVPRPVWDAHAEEWQTSYEPALLVDDDCAVCKQSGRSFNFAPLYEIEHYPDEPPGFHGLVERGRVYELFWIDGSPSMAIPSLLADLQALFSVPRTAFGFETITLDDNPREVRLRAHPAHPVSRRRARLDVEGRARLKDQFTNFLRLKSGT